MAATKPGLPVILAEYPMLPVMRIEMLVMKPRTIKG